MQKKDQQSVLLDVADGRVAVTVRNAAAEHSAVVERSDDAELVAHVPIGTRNADHLRMVLDDAPVLLKPGPGRLSRRSYNVTAVHDDVTYHLRPKSPDTSRLVRNGRTIAEFKRESDTEIKVWWTKDVEVSGADAAIGYALAGAFGTGARLFLASLLESSASHVPG
ncbi:hypothetical protein [Micromonospora musae]|uniref:hypothetical protein n=1 Tax=Micromonospora musae TaxID=1894970 RepID=UPI0034385BEB